MYLLGAMLLFFALSSLGVSAQSLEDVLSGLRANFAGVESIHAKVTIVHVIEKADLDIEPGVEVSVPLTRTFTFWQKGDSFKYEVFNVNQNLQSLVARHAHTDDQDQYFTPANGGRLNIQKHSANKEWLAVDDAVLQPYGFLYPADNGGLPGYFAHMPSLSDLVNPDLWKQLAATNNLAISPSSNGDILTVFLTISGGIDKPYYSSQYTYEINLSKEKNYFPTGYKKRNKAGNIVQEVSCTKVGSAKNSNGTLFYFPEQLVVKSYNDSGGLLFTKTSTIEDVSINSISKDDEDQLFTIDPSTAKIIFDVDKKVLITVPQ